ncbi:hypothetical protein BB8028_0010g00130 [Beauveria bassiana]|uniref:Uncharacterized protein n=1 Tax=Beauveria bassiana TaxID=176275 RepID=A0A2S7YPA3_BEABA|nr:hypothetical protein BB8028_0010g00130 [Beauveria bassiana]
MPQSSVKPVKWTGQGSRAHRERRPRNPHRHIQSVCITVNTCDGGLQYFDPITKRLQPLAEKSPGSVDTPIISRQPLDDLRPDRAGAPPTASYGAGLEELPECKVEKDDYMITGP